MRMSEYSGASSDNEVCLTHAGEAPSATKGPQWQRQVEVLMAAISPGWLLSMCYRNLSCKSLTSGNIVLWVFFLEDSCVSLSFQHLMDEREAEGTTFWFSKNQKVVHSRAELSFSSLNYLDENWFKTWKKIAKKELRWKDGKWGLPPILMYISNTFSVCCSSHVILNFLAPETGLFW